MEDHPATTEPPRPDGPEGAPAARIDDPGSGDAPGTDLPEEDLRRSVLPRAFDLLPPARPGGTPSGVDDADGAEPRVTPPRSPRARRGTRATRDLHGEDDATLTDLPPEAPLYYAAVGDRYRILERIGSGGMAEIYRVEHLDLGKQFALKIIVPELALRDKIRDLFYREARIMSQLDHPNIVAVTDFGVDPRRGAFIVMELLQGEALRNRLEREGGLGNNLIVNLGIQIADGLEFLHRSNLLHCDVKSENVFLCQPPAGHASRITAKLIDFGLSRSKAATVGHTSGSIRGTPHYLAPELIRQAPVSPRTDLYAFGVLLYEMATGECPFTGTLDEVVAGHLSALPPAISARRTAPLDPRLEALILKALEKRPEDRQPSLGQVLYELRTIADMLGISPRRSSQAIRAARPTPRRTERLADATAAHCGFCPLPTFRADREGVILSVNAAFAAFVGKPADALRGRRLLETRLAAIWPDLGEDIVAVTTSFAPRQRTLSYHPTRKSTVAVLATLLPEDGVGRPVICGVLVPLLQPGGR